MAEQKLRSYTYKCKCGYSLSVFIDCGIPQEKIAKRLGQTRDIIRDHLGIMPKLAFPPNADLSRGFSVPMDCEIIFPKIYRSLIAGG